jgi:hypothetical protein
MNDRIPLRWSGQEWSFISNRLRSWLSTIHLLSGHVRTNRTACYWLRPTVSTPVGQSFVTYIHRLTEVKSDVS